MSKQKLTPWFPGSIKPVRAGVYERLMQRNIRCFALFVNGRWLMAARSPEIAACQHHVSGLQSSFQWRGLASDPSKQEG